MEPEEKKRPTSGPFSSEEASLDYAAREYMAVKALADPDDPEATAWLAKLEAFFDRVDARKKDAAPSE
jgi:hypothetical protein